MSNYIKKALIVEAAQFGIPSPDEIKTKLSSDDTWAQRGLIAVFNEQKADEQSARRTTHLNFVGFTKFDAQFLTSMANQINAGRKMSSKQAKWIRVKMQKYAKQLFLLSLDAKRIEQTYE